MLPIISDTEMWKPVPFLEGRYEISNYGRCRSIDTYDSWGRIHRGKIIKSILDSRGYPRIRISVHCKSSSHRIHRLVAICFIPNPTNLPQVNHKDGNKTNNHHTNLEWIDNRGNQLHAIALGLKSHPKGAKAYRFDSAIKVFNRNGEHVDTLIGNADMKAKGYDWRNVNACIYGTRKSHRGMTFKRV